MPSPTKIEPDEWLAMFEAGGSERAVALGIARKLARRARDDSDVARFDERVRRLRLARPDAGARELGRELDVSYQAVYRSIARQNRPL